MSSADGAGRRRVRVIVNGGGGAARRLGTERLRSLLAEAFERAGVDATLLIVAGDKIIGHAREALDAARRGEIDGVVVGGGDGSVGSVAGIMADSGVPMGVLPLGTLNHFSKDLGVPDDLAEAAAMIGRARIARVDLGEVNGQVFTNNSLVGIYPYMVTDRERRRDAWGLGKWPAMTMAFFRMLRRFPRRRLTVEIAGRERPYRTPCMFVGVNEYEFERMQLRRAAGMAGGKLWLFVARHTSAWSFFELAVRAAFFGLAKEGDFDVLRGTAFTVRTHAHRVPVSYNGEVRRMRSPLHYKVRPGALTVFAPSEADDQASRA